MSEDGESTTVGTVEVEIGGVWEGPGWEVHFNATDTSYLHIEQGVERRGGGVPCPHALGMHDGDPKVYPAGPWGRMHTATEIESYWTVPRVVVAYNEAGHASTGVCLDCIVEWAAARQRRYAARKRLAS